jgi:ABC-type transporter Mla MlaB component
LVLDLDNVGGLDIAAMDMIGELQESAEQAGYTLELAGATSSVRDLLTQDGLATLLVSPTGPSHIDDALPPP